jgi:hypothetical protein
MTDLTSSRLIIAKGFLFLLSGLLAAGLLLYENPTVRAGLLLAVAIWCFSRFYYFAFYVIEKYVDAKFRFAGLWSFVVWLWSRRSAGAVDKERGGDNEPGDEAEPR